MNRRRLVSMSLVAVIAALLQGSAWAEPGAAVTARFLSSDEARPLAVVFTAAAPQGVANLAGILTRDPGLASTLAADFAPVPGRFVPLVHRVLRAELDSYRPLRTGALRDRKLLPARNVLVISVEEFPEVAAAYDVTGLPAYFVITSTGEIAARHEGELDALSWRAFLSCAAECVAGTCAALPGGATAAPAPAASGPAAPAGAAATQPVPVANLVTIPWTGTPPVAPADPSTSSQPAPVSPSAPATPVAPSASTPPVAPSVPATAGFPRDTHHAVTRGTFRPEGDAEEVRERVFAAPGLWTIELKTTSGEGDLDVEVLGADDARLEVSEAATGDEKIELAVRPGVIYKVRVYSFRDVEQPLGWRLSERVAPLASGRIAPGVEGEGIEDGGTIRVRVEPGTERWVRFQATRQGRYRFEVAGGPGLDAVAVTSAGEVLGRLEQSGVVFAPPEQGRVHLRVTASNGAARTAEISVAQHTVVDPSSVREEVTPERGATGSVGGGAGDERFYRLAVPSDGTYDITLRGTGPSADASDIDLEILGSNGELIERSEGPASAESIRRELEAGGTYFLRVYAYRTENSVPFRLAVAEATGPAPRPTPDQPGPAPEEIRPPENTRILPAARPVADSVAQGQSRWYRIVPASDGLLAIFLDGGDVAEDIDLAVHKADGERVEVSQTESAREALLIKASAGVPLFLRVFTYGASDGAGFRIWYQVID